MVVYNDAVRVPCILLRLVTSLAELWKLENTMLGSFELTKGICKPAHLRVPVAMWLLSKVPKVASGTDRALL
jgi:hypothetical protein